ncbi:DUF58 domain-containing protein [Breznakiella homolactica]|uniref:DUF58 domain-containing protein n=1 Tax=Breznakiella homolactica TaxID=2798577 RepID=A0A7T8BC94_9SPIR|nr:DUF58 domain-containing protein [Breznakiella homolactica]QQO10008.1 DUF58 domain-containing protein [Breznakiella homolactica]
MPESMGLKKSDPIRKLLRFIPVPQTLGLFILLITILAFTAGTVRGELALTLVGAVLVCILGYCFFGIVIVLIIHRKSPAAMTVRFMPKQLRAGDAAELIFSWGCRRRLVRLPGLLIRYEFFLSTRDGRQLHHAFDPGRANALPALEVPERGAYSGRDDALSVLDVFGFFRGALPAAADTDVRILASPRAAENLLPVSVQSGGREDRTEPSFIRSDDLIDHRPYIPGDDPRRINWKLYSHAGDLFVREGEPEPPPRSKLILLVDASADPALYTPEEARRGVDLLCSHALTLILDYCRRGADVFIGYNGSGLAGGGEAGEAAAVLAFPAAEPFEKAGKLPGAADERGVVLFALPREYGGASVLDKFMETRGNRLRTELVFLYSSGRQREAAELCAGIYGRKGGVHARSFKA